MNAVETSKILYVIRATYPSYYARFTEQDEANQLQAWTMVLSEYEYPLVSAGLKIFLTSDTKGFPPSPGQVIDCIQKMTPQPDEGMSELAAWEMVYSAICNGNYGAEEEYAKLPETCQKAVGNAANIRQWAQMDADTVSGVVMSHFLRAYRAEVKRASEFAKLPASVRALLKETVTERLEG